MNRNSKAGDVWSNQEGWVTPHRKAVLDSSALLSENLADSVMKFFSDRKGFDHWWHGIDLEIRKEIAEDLRADLAENLTKLTADNAGS